MVSICTLHAFEIQSATYARAIEYRGKVHKEKGKMIKKDKGKEMEMRSKRTFDKRLKYSENAKGASERFFRTNDQSLCKINGPSICT